MYILDNSYRDILEYCFNLYEGFLLRTSTYSMIRHAIEYEKILHFSEKEVICILIIVDVVNKHLLETLSLPYTKSHMKCFKLSQQLQEKWNVWDDLNAAWNEAVQSS